MNNYVKGERLVYHNSQVQRMNYTGVTARGIISPIFKQGDDLVTSVCETIIRAGKEEGFLLEDGDIIGITESVVARTQGNYASCEQIATDIRAKFGGKDLGIVFPIMSRNRFSMLLKSIAMGCEKLYIQLSYPGDEVGNALISSELLDEKAVNPFSDNFNEEQFRAVFGNKTTHPFTGVDYIEYYKSFGDNIEIIFSNHPSYILNYTKNVLCCDIHSRKRTKQMIKNQGGEKVFSLDEILVSSIDGSGYNEEYGLLGSNLATNDSVKLFPRECDTLVEAVQRKMKELTGKTIEVLVYGDGCFKDPVGGIWELADPVAAPAYTSRLAGTPNEIKMKYFADNELAELEGEQLVDAMRQCILEKDGDLVGDMGSQGTTPRRYSDLLASLCDLVSGSGDRGTPIVYVKGYFTNFAS